MQHLYKNMITTCDKLTKLMEDRGIITPSATIEARSGHSGARVVLRFRKAGESMPHYHFSRGDTLEDAVEAAKEWISCQPTAEERAFQDALDLTAKALEASRKAGLDTGEGAGFVAQLEAMMKHLSENAITDQRAAS